MSEKEMKLVYGAYIINYMKGWRVNKGDSVTAYDAMAAGRDYVINHNNFCPSVCFHSNQCGLP